MSKKAKKKKTNKTKLYPHPETDFEYQCWFEGVCSPDIWGKISTNREKLTRWDRHFAYDFGKQIDLIRYPTIKQLRCAYRIYNKVYPKKATAKKKFHKSRRLY